MSRIILSGFADESALTKSPVEMFAVMAALGLRYYTPRFFRLDPADTANVVKLRPGAVAHIAELQGDYGLTASSIGTPLGKTRLIEDDPGAKDPFVPLAEVLEQTKLDCEIAQALGAKLIRGFNFYPPAGDDPKKHMSQVVDWTGQIVDVCDVVGCTYAGEVEARLTSRTGALLSEIHEKVGRDGFVTCPDLGNIHCQGYTPDEVVEQAKLLVPSMGLFHVKAYDVNGPMPAQRGQVDENALKAFVPADHNDYHLRVMRYLSAHLEQIGARLKKRGIPGLFVDLEPHLKGGGQFGGFSGPDGMGVALRAFCKVCDQAKVGYDLRTFDDVRSDRGF